MVNETGLTSARKEDSALTASGKDGASAPARSHFTIGEVAREFGFTLRALRFYEEKGLISPRRSGNRRLYSKGDLRRLRIIANGKKIGLSLDDIREILKADTGESDDTKLLKVSLDKAVRRLDALEHEQAQLQDYTREAVKLINELKTKLGRETLTAAK
ncbi:MerR family transcriptional regulator [Microbaculum marinum]|uniref:MerR family transcriptional regulator n=1 Tax=Microbaculum marinum TaxID=1764581 RepID=A0AAW9RZC5_9HYPH